ncbi:hypothetical protein [Vibrio sp. D431a]|uniref:hypothetical protein n=1 Tax=Vibrio sp. D431a TaxID=2837388 RepID=UPI002555CFF8|nr:hypothetical protein [Vibrio sp. D431a]MDK9790160.1 hypothetical protein [Vibrio sp. D431a]
MDRFDVRLANALNLATPNKKIEDNKSKQPTSGLLKTLEELKQLREQEANKGEEVTVTSKQESLVSKSSIVHPPVRMIESEIKSSIEPKKSSSIRFRC